MSIQTVLEDLLATTGASRVTLRQDTPGDVFPMTHEALVPGVGSLEGVIAPNMAGQPVVLRILRGEQVVQNDCESEYADDVPFQEMLGLYGGMKAQIVTPLVRDGKTVAAISLHELRRTREWTEAEKAACREAVEKVRAELDAGRS